MAELRQDLQFKSLKLLKDCVLGSGSYGIVYKAECDELLCAGKVLHHAFFKFGDPGADTTWERFRSECQFLRVANHPHVVQYLATARDHESGIPILVMELMDESLTRFLRRQQSLLPFYDQVNFCHQIALALVYLHSNLGIIHRDLSSNNVLLLAGSRVKITDFGMSKVLRQNPGGTPLTVCPGTQSYMPPEALECPALYTDKLDCFSHGVLSIQIMTCLFPDPSPSKKKVQDLKYPLGEILVPIAEKERRRSHIDLIDTSHPLLPIALSCLEYNAEERPSASQLCTHLATLKVAPPHTKYIHCMQEQGRRAVCETSGPIVPTARTESKCSTRTDCENGNAEIDNAQCSTTMVSPLCEVQERGLFVSEKKEASTKVQQKLEAMEDALTTKGRKIEKVETTAAEEIVAMTHEVQQLTQALEQARLSIQEKEQLIELGKKQLHKTNQLLLESEETVSQFQRSLEVGGDAAGQVMLASFPACTSSSIHPAVATSTQRTLMWRRGCSRPPRAMIRGYVATNGSTVYFTPHLSNDVYAYLSQGESWSRLPSCPYRCFSMAVVNRLLTTIGGAETGMAGRVTNTLVSLVGEGLHTKWSRKFPPMRTKRQLTSAVCTGNHLVVIGGVAHGRLSVVEVMHTQSLEWAIVSSLPHPLSESSATVVEDRLYLVGGLDGSGMSTSVLSCLLTALLQSNESPSFRERFSRRRPVWQTVSKLQFCRATVVNVDGHLLAVGGCEVDKNPTDAVYAYEPSTDLWHVVGRLSIARCSCLAAVLPGDILMVVGGKASSGTTATVDTATLE